MIKNSAIRGLALLAMSVSLSACVIDGSRDRGYERVYSTERVYSDRYAYDRYGHRHHRRSGHYGYEDYWWNPYLSISLGYFSYGAGYFGPSYYYSPAYAYGPYGHNYGYRHYGWHHFPSYRYSPRYRYGDNRRGDHNREPERPARRGELRDEVRRQVRIGRSERDETRWGESRRSAPQPAPRVRRTEREAGIVIPQTRPAPRTYQRRTSTERTAPTTRAPVVLQRRAPTNNAASAPAPRRSVRTSAPAPRAAAPRPATRSTQANRAPRPAKRTAVRQEIRQQRDDE